MRQKLFIALCFYLLSLVCLGAPTVAFFYGRDVPVAELSAYDWAVVEPAHLPAPPTGHTQWLAYLSLGEVTPDRAYARQIPAAWQLGKNQDWGGWIIDQKAAEWPDFVVEKMVTPLWNAGYRGFFLDTLDSFQIVSKTEAERQAQMAGLVRVITAIKQRYPDAQLIANRGFEIMPQIHRLLGAVAFESLYQGWHAGKRQYQEVSPQDRQWLLAQIQPIRQEYKLPVIAIDYVPPHQRALARQTAQRIRAAGLIPHVGDAQLEGLGVGELEIQPRTVLLLYDGRRTGSLLSANLRLIATPLHYLGLTTRYHDIRAPLPEGLLAGRIAGMVSWLDEDDAPAPFQAWLKRQIQNGVPWVALSRFGFRLNPEWQALLQLKMGEAQAGRGVEIMQQDSGLAYEIGLQVQKDSFLPLQNAHGQALLTLKNAASQHSQMVAITDWGGYALFPYLVRNLPDDTARWQINPFTFLSQALRLQQTVAPDATTENGRRIFISHVDGDGFVSPAEFASYPPAGEVLLKEVLQKTPLPVTMSIIEGEIAPSGLYPEQSTRLEAIARQIFALPNIEIATHAYSHPFKWQAGSKGGGEDYHLKIPGYTFNLEREIKGSAAYIDSRLAPAGKKTRIMLWTGDCDPSEEAIRISREAGLLNMNAGDTVITRSLPTMTEVAPVGIYKGRELQIFAPNQNENVYTNDWQGPFYGYQRVIETFEMTDKPLRLKPVNIYYHTYSASKKASLIALQKVYAWAMKQPITPLFASGYIERAQGFFNATIARNNERYEIRNLGALRTLRLHPQNGYPDLARSRNIAGFYDDNGVRYVHLSAGEASLVLSPNPPARPYLAYANAPLGPWQATPNGLQFDLQGWLPLRFGLAHAQNCQLLGNGKRIEGRTQGLITHFELPQNAAALQLSCPR